MSLPPALAEFSFSTYLYICLAVALLGSLIRYDREPYSWKSDSSQILRNRLLKSGSHLFHYGVLVVILGHFAGFLMPEPLVRLVLSPVVHELLAMVVGGVAGAVAIAGMSILVYRRLADARVRRNSRKWDIAVALMLWLQLALGLLTIPYSAAHFDSDNFHRLILFVQSIVYFKGQAWVWLEGLPWVYHAHILLGFTIFLVTPFTRLVHIWSGVGALAYLFRPHQLMRKKTRAIEP